ncbi:MAG: hypothetical protein K6F92_02800 [Lachnospiraceae bacterium]|nr:hypothetical protein [Lachnospiraceae bacterium]
MKKIRLIFTSILMVISMMVLNIVPALAVSSKAAIAVSSTTLTLGEELVIGVALEDPASDIVAGGYALLINNEQIGMVDFTDASDYMLTVAYTPQAAGEYVVSLGPISDSATGYAEIITAEALDTPSVIEFTPVTITVTEAPTGCAHDGATHLVNTVEATCGTDGYTGDTVCDLCGETIAAGEVIPATGNHNFVDGVCTVCGAKDPNYVAPTVTGIEVKYTGATTRTEGDAITGFEIEVYQVYSDGSKTRASEGWGCAMVGVPLTVGTANIKVDYGGYSAYFTVNVVAAATTPVETPEETTVAEEETTVSEEETTVSEEETTAPEGTAFIKVTSPFGGDDLYVATDWDDESVKPVDGFEYNTAEYAGYQVKALTNEAGITLFYLTDDKGENGDFYIYDKDTDKFGYYITIPGNSVGYYILAFPDDFDTTGMTKMTITLDAESGKAVTAYHISQEREESGTVCLVYAVDEDGNKGYYRFDTNTLSFVRYYKDKEPENVTPVEPVDVPTQPEETEPSSQAVNTPASNSNDEAYKALATKYNNDIRLRFIVIMILIALSVILFIFVMVLALKLKKLYSEYDFVDDEDDEEEEEEEEDDEEYEDDDEEVEEDDEEDVEEEDEEVDEEPEDEKPEDEDFRVDLSSIEEEEEK